MRNRSLGQIFFGAVILLIGVAALLSTLGVIDMTAGQMWSYGWPILVILLGVFMLASNPRAWGPPAIVILIGVFFELNALDVITVSLWSILWPVALIAIGVILLAGHLGSKKADDSEIVNMVAFWTGPRRVPTTQNFRAGSITAIMGGADLDLRHAGIRDTADITVFTFWGGADIIVPPTWRVELSYLPILGGAENKAVPVVDPGAPLLRVHATCVMAGVTIKN